MVHVNFSFIETSLVSALTTESIRDMKLREREREREILKKSFQYKETMKNLIT